MLHAPTTAFLQGQKQTLLHPGPGQRKPARQGAGEEHGMRQGRDAQTALSSAGRKGRAQRHTAKSKTPQAKDAAGSHPKSCVTWLLRQRASPRISVHHTGAASPQSGCCRLFWPRPASRICCIPRAASAPPLSLSSPAAGRDRGEAGEPVANIPVKHILRPTKACGAGLSVLSTLKQSPPCRQRTHFGVLRPRQRHQARWKHRAEGHALGHAGLAGAPAFPSTI